MVVAEKGGMVARKSSISLNLLPTVRHCELSGKEGQLRSSYFAPPSWSESVNILGTRKEGREEIYFSPPFFRIWQPLKMVDPPLFHFPSGGGFSSLTKLSGGRAVSHCVIYDQVSAIWYFVF